MDTQAWVGRGHSTRHAREVWLLFCSFVDLGLVFCFFVVVVAVMFFFFFLSSSLQSNTFCRTYDKKKKKKRRTERKGRTISTVMHLSQTRLEIRHRGCLLEQRVTTEHCYPAKVYIPFTLEAPKEIFSPQTSEIAGLLTARGHADSAQ